MSVAIAGSSSIARCSHVVHFAAFSYGRANKLRRLDDFRRTKPHCSASALGQILTDIKTHGLPELTDRVSMREGRDPAARLVTPYGCILKPMSAVDKTGVMVELPSACPLASLTYALEESDG